MAGAGYKLFNTGDVLTAAQVNTYLNEQTVMVFASSAARTSALSGVLAEGMMSYLQDTNAVEVYDGSNWVSIGSSGDITGITTGTDSGLSGGVTSGTATLRLKLEFDAETGTTYTLVAGNLNQLVTLNNASSITLTVPPSVFSTGATASAPKLRAQYSAASIICTASNTFLVVGDIS